MFIHCAHAKNRTLSRPLTQQSRNNMQVKDLLLKTLSECRRRHRRMYEAAVSKQSGNARGRIELRQACDQQAAASVQFPSRKHIAAITQLKLVIFGIER